MKRTIFFILFSLFIIDWEVNAQPAAQLAGDDHLSAIALAAPGRIVLRWGPASPRAWDHANQVGYIVERLAISAPGDPDPAGFQRLANQPIQPWTLEEWEQHFVEIERVGSIENINPRQVDSPLGT